MPTNESHVEISNADHGSDPQLGGEKRSRAVGSRRGFAAMDSERQRAIASKGGHSQGKANNPGNFANNRERARQAGRKGGMA
jgi:general stress protein YciG